MKFLNEPWRVERDSGELLVVDAKNMIVATFSLDDVPGSVEDEEKKAFALAAMPGVFSAARSFLNSLVHEAESADEALLLNKAGELELALKAATVIPPPPPAPIAKKPVVKKR